MAIIRSAPHCTFGAPLNRDVSHLPSAMPRFRVVITGIPQPNSTRRDSGFATTRFVRAWSPASAAETAIAVVAMDIKSDLQFEGWGTPALAVDTIAEVRSPFKLSRPNKGFTFCRNGATLDDALSIERKAGAGWFL